MTYEIDRKIQRVAYVFKHDGKVIKEEIPPDEVDILSDTIFTEQDVVAGTFLLRLNYDDGFNDYGKIAQTCSSIIGSLPPDIRELKICFDDYFILNDLSEKKLWSEIIKSVASFPGSIESYSFSVEYTKGQCFKCTDVIIAVLTELMEMTGRSKTVTLKKLYFDSCFFVSPSLQKYDLIRDDIDQIKFLLSNLSPSLQAVGFFNCGLSFVKPDELLEILSGLRATQVREIDLSANDLLCLHHDVIFKMMQGLSLFPNLKICDLRRQLVCQGGTLPRLETWQGHKSSTLREDDELLGKRLAKLANEANFYTRLPLESHCCTAYFAGIDSSKARGLFSIFNVTGVETVSSSSCKELSATEIPRKRTPEKLDSSDSPCEPSAKKAKTDGDVEIKSGELDRVCGSGSSAQCSVAEEHLEVIDSGQEGPPSFQAKL